MQSLTSEICIEIILDETSTKAGQERTWPYCSSTRTDGDYNLKYEVAGADDVPLRIGCQSFVSFKMFRYKQLKDCLLSWNPTSNPCPYYSRLRLLMFHEAAIRLRSEEFHMTDSCSVHVHSCLLVSGCGLDKHKASYWLEWWIRLTWV